MHPYVIETEDLCLDYGSKAALRKLNLRIPRGGIHALIGANGAGKSSLFRVLLGFEAPTAGSARILGHDSATLTPELRGRIGFVNEEHTLPGWMRVAELRGLQQRQYPQWSDARFDAVIKNFNVQPRQYVSELSRGERAGVSLALAMAQSPELLILDEPTLGLDIVAKRLLLEALMFSVDASDATIIYCSHQMDEIERVADQLVIVENGSLRHMSSPEEFCGRIRLWAAALPSRSTGLEALPGLLQLQELDGITQLMVMDAPADFEQRLQAFGAQHISHSEVPLHRAVDSLLASRHAAAVN